MSQKFFSLLLIATVFFYGCSAPNSQNPFAELEAAYNENPGKDTGEALVAAYEATLDTLSDKDQKISLLGKAATHYFKMGANEGLAANFSRLVNEFPNADEATNTAQGILDTLLHNITDPNTQRLIPGIARQYMSLTEIYAKAKPDAPESPEQLYKSGEIARSIGAFPEALSIYATIEGYFPQYEKAPKALFMQAFTYAEDLGNEEQARKLYEAFIAKYPEDDFVDDAQILLETLGKSDEEIFQQLEKK